MSTLIQRRSGSEPRITTGEHPPVMYLHWLHGYIWNGSEEPPKVVRLPGEGIMEGPSTIHLHPDGMYRYTLPNYTFIVDDFGESVVVWTGSGNSRPQNLEFTYQQPESPRVLVTFPHIGGGVYLIHRTVP